MFDYGNDPVYPVDYDKFDTSNRGFNAGLTKRELFSSEFMAAFLRSEGYEKLQYPNDDLVIQTIAKVSKKCADILINELNT